MVVQAVDRSVDEKNFGKGLSRLWSYEKCVFKCGLLLESQHVARAKVDVFVLDLLEVSFVELLHFDSGLRRRYRLLAFRFLLPLLFFAGLRLNLFFAEFPGVSSQEPL